MRPVKRTYPEPVDLKLLTKLKIAVFIKSVDLHYVMINDGTAEMIGADSKSTVGTDDYAHFDEARALLMQNRDRDILQSGKIKRYDSVVQDADQSWVHFKTTKLPLFDPAGKAVGLICVSMRSDQGDPKETLACYQYLSDVLETDPQKITSLLMRTTKSI